MSAAMSPAAPPRSRDATLSRRASLNALAALIDYGARIVIQLVLAPLMLRSLGAGGFGTWQVVQRLVGHATPAGGRPGEALKWVVAQAQTSDDEQRKREQVGTALAVWVLFLPLVGVLGFTLAWFAPAVVRAGEGGQWTVRGAAALLVVNLMLLGLGAVPQSVLLGENLGYRRLGLSTSVLFVGALLTALSLWAGWGLVGLALCTIVTTVLSGVTYLQIVRRQVTWWGVAQPVRGAVRGFVSLSWWFLLWNLVMQVMKGGDLIVLGAVAGTTAAATYSLTSLVPQAVSDVIFVVISATMPGLGGLVGAGELKRAARVRAETLVLSWLLAVSAGATVIVWLPAFLALWVGAKYDAGATATLLICVMVLQFALIRVDSNIIDVTLRVRAKVLLGLLSAGLSVVLGVLLVGPADLGIAGLVAAFVLGRLPVTVAYPLLLARLLQLPKAFTLNALWRPAVTSGAMFAVAWWLGGVGVAGGWLSVLTLGSLTAVAATAAAYGAGLSSSQRADVRARVLRVVRAS
jgi:O-antigen/teichoic acid export membrane protein